MASAPLATPVIAGTRIAWPAGSGRWVALTTRADAVQVIAGDASRAEAVAGASLDGAHAEIDDTFHLTPVGDKLIVSRSTVSAGDGTRAALLLAQRGATITVAQRWTGLEGEQAPFERGTAQDIIAWPFDDAPLRLAVAQRGKQARLVTFAHEARADVEGGAFATAFDADDASVSYRLAGDRVIARLSIAGNEAANCEALLIAPHASGARVVERWRGDCTARARFEPAE